MSVKRFGSSDSKEKEERDVSKPKFGEHDTDFIFILSYLLRNLVNITEIICGFLRGAQLYGYI